MASTDKISKLWASFQSPLNPKRTFWIETAEEKHYDEILNCMAKYYYRDEPMYYCMGAHNNAASLANGKERWLACLQKHLSIVCLTQLETEPPELAGSFLLYDSSDPPKWKEIWCAKIAKKANTTKYLTDQANIKEKLNLSRVLIDFGVLVLPEFRKQGVGEELTLAATKVGAANNIKVMSIFCSSPGSQRIAEKLKFIEAFSISHKDLRKIGSDKYGIDNIEKVVEYVKYYYIFCT